MATVLRLANGLQTNIVDFISGTLKLGEPFTTRTPENVNNYTYTDTDPMTDWKHYGVKNEVITLVGEDTNANLIAGIKAIEVLLEQARLWHRDTKKTDAVWLEWNADTEGAKRALVYEGSISILGDPPGASALLKRGIVRCRLNLSVHPVSEDTSASSNISSSVTYWASTGHSLTGGGTFPSRITAATHGTSVSNKPSGNNLNIWVGIRPTHKGLTSFNPITEAESGTLLTDAALVTISGASGGASNNVVRVTFATTTLVSRLNLYPAGWATSPGDYPQHYVGDYMVLCRCRLTASGQCGIQMKSGFYYDANINSLSPNSEVFITNTNWRLIELGAFRFPATTIRGSFSDSIALSSVIQILAERTSGTPNLEIDAIFLMPSEHSVFVKNLPTGLKFNAVVAEHGVVEVYGNTSFWPVGNMYTNPDFSYNNWHLPVEGGKLFVAMDSETEHVLNTASTLSIVTVKRYLSYKS